MRRDVHSDGVPILCLACEARHKGICGALKPDELVEMSKSASKRKVPAGTELIDPDERNERCSNILTGMVKLSRSLPDGRRQIVGLQSAPDFLGNVFDDQTELTARAATPVSLCSFPRTTLERMMEKSPDLERRILRQTVQQLDQARSWMVTLGRKTATERLATFLLYVARNIDPYAESGRKVVSFDLPMSRGDIADFLGLTIETISRQLSKLRAEGLITIESGRQVTVNDVDRLAAKSGSQSN